MNSPSPYIIFLDRNFKLSVPKFETETVYPFNELERLEIIEIDILPFL